MFVLTWLWSLFKSVFDFIAKLIVFAVVAAVALVIVGMFAGDGLPRSMVLELDLRRAMDDKSQPNLLEIGQGRLAIMDVVMGLDAAAGGRPHVDGVHPRSGPHHERERRGRREDLRGHLLAADHQDPCLAGRGRQVGHREILGVEVARVGGLLVLLQHQVLVVLAQRLQVALAVHAHEGGELQEAGIDLAAETRIRPRHDSDYVPPKPVRATLFGQHFRTRFRTFVAIVEVFRGALNLGEVQIQIHL